MNVCSSSGPYGAGEEEEGGLLGGGRGRGDATSPAKELVSTEFSENTFSRTPKFALHSFKICHCPSPPLPPQICKPLCGPGVCMVGMCSVRVRACVCVCVGGGGGGYMWSINMLVSLRAHVYV